MHLGVLSNLFLILRTYVRWKSVKVYDEGDIMSVWEIIIFQKPNPLLFTSLLLNICPPSLSLFVLFCKRTPLSASCNGVCVFVCLFAKMSVIFQLNQTPTWMQYNVLFLLHRGVDCSGHSCLKVTVPRFPGIRPSLESMKLHSGYWLYFSFCSVSGKIKRRLRAKPWRMANMLLTYEQPGHC